MAYNPFNPQIKLTDEQVKAIHSDPRGCRATAKTYGVAKSTVARIRLGIVRKHLRLPVRAPGAESRLAEQANA